jgi:DNA-binding NarL/FixJ family response regulator
MISPRFCSIPSVCKGKSPLIAEGRKNREITDYLCNNNKTVEKHRINLMKKLNLHDTTAITTYALEKGLGLIAK